MRLLSVVGFLALASAAAAAQPGQSPRRVHGSAVTYPPIARAAHVQGDAVASFTINDDGEPVDVQVVSGPTMLTQAVQSTITGWRFATPLPISASRDFTATYHFQLADPAEDLDDDLDAPPYIPCCGDMILLPPEAFQVTGNVTSSSGEIIEQSETHAGAAPTQPRCPGDGNRTPPETTAPGDFVELRRVFCNSETCRYRVRVTRNGLVEWHNDLDPTHAHDTNTQIDAAIAASLLARFSTETFWSACAVDMPATRQPELPDREAYADRSNALTASIGGKTKSVDVTNSSFADDDTGPRLAWAVDVAADTHRWRHGDPATEPFTNMQNDIQMPKPGVTKLIRAVYRFNKRNAEYTVAPLKHLLAAGADANEADASGWTPLMYAEELALSDDRAETLLLAAQADATHVSLHGDTALLIAAYHGDLRDALLAHGAKINAANPDGVTVLMLLAQHIHPEPLQEALQAGADAGARDAGGRTALDYLLAASCKKAIVPLPVPWMAGVPTQPARCPADTEDLRKSKALLTAAVTKAANSARSN